MVCEGGLEFGGIDYLLQCIVETDDDSGAVQWQSLLGRLYVLEQLIQERAVDFKATSCIKGSTTVDVITEPRDCHTRTLIVLQFVAQHISFPHAKAAKLAYRVFFQAAALQVTIGGMAVVNEVCQLLESANTQIQWRVRRKLQSVAGDYVRDKARQSVTQMPSESLDQVPSANVDPVVFYVSAQPAPQMEVVPNSSNDTDTTVTLESSSRPLESVVSSADKEFAEARSPSEKRFVVVSKQTMMIDACVQTSPISLHRRKIMTAASSIDDNSDSEFSASCRVTGPFGLHMSDSTALLDSHGSASGSHGSTSGMTDDLTDFAQTPQNVDEKVSFKKEVALSPSDSLERNEGMILADCLVSS